MGGAGVRRPPFSLLRMLGDEAFDVLFGCERRGQQLLSRHLLAFDQLDRRLDRHAAHLLRLLGGGDVEHSVLQRCERRRVAVEARDPDLMVGIGDLDRLGGA